MLDYGKDWQVDLEDGSIWFLQWFQDAGSFAAQRWFPDDATDVPYADCPGGEDLLCDSLSTLEAAMGRALPGRVRDELLSYSECFPFTEQMRADWGEAVAYGITRLHPSGEFLETFASPGSEDPFAIEWLPEWMT